MKSSGRVPVIPVFPAKYGSVFESCLGHTIRHGWHYFERLIGPLVYGSSGNTFTASDYMLDGVVCTE